MAAPRTPVRKTYKLYVGGAFPRSESGRTYRPVKGSDPNGDALSVHNVARGSRKDLREAVVVAAKAQPGWAGRTAYNRGQILFRIGEMIEARRDALVAEIREAADVAGKDVSVAAARNEVDATVDLVSWYAGLADKLQSLLGSQNAVAGPFFNFSTVEATGVIGVIAPHESSLLGLLAFAMPMLVGGNTVVCLLAEQRPFAGLALGEVCASSDVPGGVINLISGQRDELVQQLASHRELDGLFVAGEPDRAIGEAAADTVKRVRFLPTSPATFTAKKSAQELRSLLLVEPFVEVKTFWHPVSS